MINIARCTVLALCPFFANCLTSQVITKPDSQIAVGIDSVGVLNQHIHSAQAPSSNSSRPLLPSSKSLLLRSENTSGIPVFTESKHSANASGVHLTAEDKGIALLAPLLLNLSWSSWAWLCLVGLACVLWGMQQLKLNTNQQRQQQQEDATMLQALPLALLWVFIGTALILFNKCMYMRSGSGFGFPRPVFLMWFQNLIIAVLTNIVRVVRPEVMPSLASKEMGARAYFLAFLPIASLQALGLVLGNLAYLHVSVSQIQMIKNTTSAFVYIFCCCLRLEQMTTSSSLAVSLVMLGLMISTAGDLDFSMFGFILQMGGTLSDALRLSLTKVIMSTKHSVRLDPMSACCLFNSSMFLLLIGPMYYIDFPHINFAEVWNLKFVLCANAMLAMSLNMSSMLYMSRVGATTYALTGVIKDLLLVLSLLLLFGHNAWLEAIGFGMAVTGVLIYNKLKTG